MKIKIRLLLLICICFSRMDAQVLTLDSVLNRIQNNNPMLRMYDEQVHAAANFASGSKAWMPPKLSTGPWQTPYMSFRDGMWMITAEQMIPNPAKQKAGYNYMHSMSAVEAEGKSVKQNEMFAMAKQNYYEWIILKRKEAVLRETDSLLAYMLQLAKQRFTYNREKLSTIYKAEADLSELRNMETMVLSDIQMKKTELITLMNTDRSFVFDIDTALSERNYELQLPDTAYLTSHRSELRQLDAEMKRLRLQQEMERSKRLPDVGVSVSHMQSFGGMANQYAAMGMITLPMLPWASKEYKANVRGLDNATGALQYQKQARINEIAGEIASLQNRMMAAKKQLKNYRENIIPLYYKSYQASLTAYEQNSEDLFMVLDALKMYRMIKMNELDQYNELLKLQVDYEKQLEMR